MMERLALAAVITFLLNVILNLNAQTIYSAQQTRPSKQEPITIAQGHSLFTFRSILRLGNY